jgi:hypothetical protein
MTGKELQGLQYQALQTMTQIQAREAVQSYRDRFPEVVAAWSAADALAQAIPATRKPPRDWREYRRLLDKFDAWNQVVPLTWLIFIAAFMILGLGGGVGPAMIVLGLAVVYAVLTRTRAEVWWQRWVDYCDATEPH